MWKFKSSFFFIDLREGRYFWEHFFVARRSSNFRMAAYACVTCFWPKRRRFDLGNIVAKNLQVSNMSWKASGFCFFLGFPILLDLSTRMPLQITVGPGWAFDLRVPRQEPRDSGGPLSTIHRAIHEELGVSMEETESADFFFI